MKRLALPREILRLAGVVAVMLATSFLLQGAVTVTADETLKTKANVSAEGIAPVIECKWELPDMQVGDGPSSPFPDDTFEYAAIGDAHRHDDAPLVGPTPVFPCSLDPAAKGGPTMADGARHMIQLKPNAGDLPEERRFQMWMAVDHPNGISNIDDVYWDVFHPDGSPKTQVHGIAINKGDCGKLDTMFDAAWHTGQVAATAIVDPVGGRGMVDLCHEGVKKIYWGEWTVSKDQPCGEYQVVAHAVASGVQAKTITNYFDVICFIHGEIDFGALDFGGMTPGRTKVLDGDLVWDDPADNKPTVRNLGNIGMEPMVEFHLMCNSDDIILRKCITQFDVSFGRSPATLQHIDPIFVAINPGPPVVELPGDHTDRVDFDNTRPRVLCSDEMGKLDFSVHPPNTLPSGTYAGGVDIFFQAVRGICATDQEEELLLEETAVKPS